MGALSKRAIGAALIDQHIAHFACPLCQQSMHVYEQGDSFVLPITLLILPSRAMSIC